MPLKDPEARRAYHRKYMKDWYAKNGEKHRQAVANSNRRTAENRRSFIEDLKSKTPCADCGNHFPSECMDFDHLRDKKFDIGRVSNRASMTKLLAEIAKCEIVCSNCHRTRTRMRRQLTADVVE